MVDTEASAKCIKIAGTGRFGAYGHHVFRRDLRPAASAEEVAFWIPAASVPVPTFFDHVLHVVAVGTEPQVPWIDATSVVAGMADMPIWEISKAHLPSHSVRGDRRSAEFGAELTVPSGRNNTGGPDPAGEISPGAIHLGPEAVLKSKIPSSHEAPPMPIGQGRRGVDTVPVAPLIVAHRSPVEARI